MRKCTLVLFSILLTLAILLTSTMPASANIKNLVTMLFFGHGNPNANNEILVEVWVWNPMGEYWTRFWGIQRIYSPENTGPKYSRLYHGYTHLLANPSWPTPFSLSGQLSTSNKTFPSMDVIRWDTYGVQYTHIGNINQKDYIDGPVSEGCEVLFRDGGQTTRWQLLMDLFKLADATKVRAYWFWDGGDAGGLGRVNWDRIWDRFIKLPKPTTPLSGEPGNFFDSPIGYPIYNYWWEDIPWVPEPKVLAYTD